TWRFTYLAGVIAAAYMHVRNRIKATLEKATRAASFWSVGRDFRPTLWANSECADHLSESRSRVPCLLLLKLLSEVTPRLQQLNREADPITGSLFSRLCHPATAAWRRACRPSLGVCIAARLPRSHAPQSHAR